MKCNRSVKARLKVERTHSQGAVPAPWPLPGAGRYCIKLTKTVKGAMLMKIAILSLSRTYVVNRPGFLPTTRACSLEPEDLSARSASG